MAKAGGDDIRLEWVKPPLQARSQQTLERLLDAAEAIIDEKGIEKATVSEIAKRADSSVGAFYSRFADKEALLKCVLERFNDQAVATAEAVLVPARWEGIPVENALEMMMTFMLGILREKRRLILALTMRAAVDPQLSAFGERLHETIARLMHVLIVHRGHTVRHPDPETAIHLAVWLVLSAVESRTLHDHPDREARLSDQTIAREITEMVIRYVGVGAPAQQAPTDDRETVAPKATVVSDAAQNAAT
jgi:AcrR family transcriptional regulator